MPDPLSRRTFIRDTAAATAGLAAAGALAAPPDSTAPTGAAYASAWEQLPDRVWLGRELWANPLQDWRVAGGRIECTQAAADRHVQLLTHDVGPQAGRLAMSVRIGRVGGGRLDEGQGSAGFRVGIRGALTDYRHALIYGRGLDAGLTADGRLFIGPEAAAQRAAVDTSVASLELRLAVEPAGAALAVTLSAHAADGTLLGQVRREQVPTERLAGNLALAANFGAPAGGPRQPARLVAGAGQFWFADWRVAGSALQQHDERSFGPILFNQYTLHRRTLKMTAQMPPLGPHDTPSVRLELRQGDHWKTIAEEPIHPEARTATFRIGDWNDAADTPYRLAYTERFTDGTLREHLYAGTVRRDPVDRPVLTVADISCNTHAAFPNADYVAHVAKLNPDLLAFVGDQFYESSGGYGVRREPLDAAILDYLRKWYLHGWTWRELTRDRPSVSLPDDHDVYQGNIWGEAGAARHGTQEMGGYDMPAAWVNVVHRTQASHHPDPPDATPLERGTTVFYGPLTYGRVSFAIIADRQFKSGPEGKVPPTGSRGDHVTDPNFDPKTADLPGLELLGRRQLKFLADWVLDWAGADMKAVISQTIFTAMATHHGGGHERLVADYDANGWPQSGRHAALRTIRKAFAFHIAGDQHLPALIHYGIDAHRDAGVAFAGPAVNVGYPRWWEPSQPGANRAAGQPENTGDFLDHFGNKLTVLAVANGAIKPRPGLLEGLQDKASGLGIVRFDKLSRTVTIECWPLLADPAQPGTQFPGWPVTIPLADNYGRVAAAHLPTLHVDGATNPVVQVFDEANGELVYALRVSGHVFQPHVFAAGKYTVRVGDADQDRWTQLAGLVAAKDNRETIKVTL